MKPVILAVSGQQRREIEGEIRKSLLRPMEEKFTCEPASGDQNRECGEFGFWRGRPMDRMRPV
jgi:hypothetical protein